MDSAGYLITHYLWADETFTERPAIENVHVTELVMRQICFVNHPYFVQLELNLETSKFVCFAGIDSLIKSTCNMLL